MRRSRASVLVAFAIVVLTLFAAACGGDDESSGGGTETADAASLKGQSVRLWIMNNGPQPVEDTDAIVKPFEERTGIDVEALVRVVLPAAAPGVTATFVYAFLMAWDELLFVTALTEHTAETIPIGIRNFIGNHSEEYAQLMAAGVVSTIPVMLAFFATQRWLVKGLTAGAVKG